MTRTFMVFIVAALGLGTNLPATQGAETPTRRVVVFYFHNTWRCPSCNTLENLTKAAVLGEPGENMLSGDKVAPEKIFAPLVADGRLSFQSVNLDEGDNEKLLAAYQTKPKLPVLVEFEGESVKRTETLDQTWKLLPQSEKLVAYVQARVKAFVQPLTEK